MRGWLVAWLAFVSFNEPSQAQPTSDTGARIKTCLGYESSARQECFDLLWQELMHDTLPFPPAGDGGWIVSETMSPLDYSPQITATKVMRLTSGNAPSLLTIGCRGQRIELSIGTSGTWSPSSGDDLKVTYRIDNQPEVQDRWAALAGGRSAVFRGDAAKLLSLLPDPGRLAIRVHDSQGPSAPTAFDLAGLDPIRQKITSTCKSAPAKAQPEPQWR